MSSITLPPTLGVNARMTKCPWCGESSGLVLLGAANYWQECPSCSSHVYGGIDRKLGCPSCGHKIAHYDPMPEKHKLGDETTIPVAVTCSRCEDAMKIGVFIMMAEERDGKPVRLGPVVCIKEEAFKKIPMDQALIDQALKKRAIYMDREAWIKLGLPIDSEDKG